MRSHIALEKLIETKQQEIERLRCKAQTVSGINYSGDRIQNSGSDSMCIVDKIVMLENTLRQEIENLIDLESDIRKHISRVYNLRYIAILTDKYINHMTFEQIAEKLNITDKTVIRCHGDALQIFRIENNMA